LLVASHPRSTLEVKLEDYEYYEEQDKQEFVRYLLQNDYLAHPTEQSVARQYIDQGYSSLTTPQKAVIDGVLEEHAIVCDLWQDPVPWNDQIEALDSGIYGTCEYRRNRILEDD
jgi:hypothetical protein